MHVSADGLATTPNATDCANTASGGGTFLASALCFICLYVLYLMLLSYVFFAMCYVTCVINRVSFRIMYCPLVLILLVSYSFGLPRGAILSSVSCVL
jgi:hypothetical protein